MGEKSTPGKDARRRAMKEMRERLRNGVDVWELQSYDSKAILLSFGITIIQAILAIVIALQLMPVLLVPVLLIDLLIVASLVFIPYRIAIILKAVDLRVFVMRFLGLIAIASLILPVSIGGSSITVDLFIIMFGFDPVLTVLTIIVGFVVVIILAFLLGVITGWLYRKWLTYWGTSLLKRDADSAARSALEKDPFDTSIALLFSYGLYMIMGPPIVNPVYISNPTYYILIVIFFIYPLARLAFSWRRWQWKIGELLGWWCLLKKPKRKGMVGETS